MTSPTSPHTDSTVQNNPHDQPHNQPNNQSQNQPQQDDRLARQIARHQPLYGANPGNAFARYFSKYAVFTGRASRSEYWWMQFWAMIVETIVAPLIIGGMATFAVIPLINAVQGDSINWTLLATNTGGIVFVTLLFLLVSRLVDLALVIPSLSLRVRRLHDANHSGWWAAFWFVPMVLADTFFSILILAMMGLITSLSTPSLIKEIVRLSTEYSDQPLDFSIPTNAIR